MGENRRVKSRPELPQLPDRELGLLEGVGDRSLGFLAGGGSLDGLQGEDDVDQTLLGAVVEISAEASPLVERCLHDPGARGMNRLRSETFGLGAAAIGHVAEDHHRPAATAHVHRSRRVGHRNEGPISADEPVLVHVHCLSGHPWPQQRTLGLRKRPAIRVLVMDRRVAPASDQVGFSAVSEDAQRCRIGEQDDTGVVDGVDGVDHALEQRRDELLPVRAELLGDPGGRGHHLRSSHADHRESRPA